MCGRSGFGSMSSDSYVSVVDKPVTSTVTEDLASLASRPCRRPYARTENLTSPGLLRNHIATMTHRSPNFGGTLRYFGPGGMDHVDPAAAYYAFSHQIIRLFTRQLFSYPTALDESALRPVPDLAVEIPTVENGGLSPDGRRYTIRIRRGTHWDTSPPREVTAHDVIRGV